MRLDTFTERVMRKNKNNQSKLPLTISAQYGLVDQITFFNKVVASTDMSNYYLLKKGEFAYKIMLYQILYCNILNLPNGIKEFLKLPLRVHEIMGFSMYLFRISSIHTIMCQRIKKSKSRLLSY